MTGVYHHRAAFLLHGFWLIGYVFLSKEVWETLIDKWLNSGTYSHGFFVFFFSAILIYQKKDRLARISPELMESSFIAFIIFGILWFFSTVVQLKIGAQLSVIGFLIGSVALFWGKAIFYEIKFPLFFLLLALPVGYELVPIFQWITAQYVQAGLRLFSIPVWQEGVWLFTSAGTFEIGPSCSGFRYAIAILAGALLYAHWKSWSVWRTVLLILAALFMAISANGIRAACIVIWATLTDTYYAIVFDHEIYGWAFFSCILLFFFLLTELFSIKNTFKSDDIHNSVLHHHYSFLRMGKTEIAALLCTSTVLYAQLLASQQSTDVSALRTITLPTTSVFEQISSKEWPVSYVGAVRRLSQGYRIQQKAVTVTVALYGQQKSDQALVQFKNKPYQAAEWSLIEDHFFKIQSKGYRRIQLKRGLDRKTLVVWYCIDGISTPYGWETKMIDAYQWLVRKPRHAGAIVLSWDGTWNDNQQAIEIFSPWIRQTVEEQFKMIS